jgi:oxygen-independent coproporphyrinogen-3 oxidase
LHLYLHIPFCTQACHYCDFHFSTNTANKSAIVDAIARELVMRSRYLSSPRLETVYFGGGTPSLLTERELAVLMETIHTQFDLASDVEITLEANPDDLNKVKLKQLADAGINRLSIGIQSFHQPHLMHLNRIHSATEAIQCVKDAQDVGITNISVDLIYAIAADNHDILEDDIKKAVELEVSHLSAYCLTIEPQTAFGSWLKKKKIKPIDEEFAAQQFEILIASLAKNGFEQYEISNFAKNNLYSRHNSSYWQQRPYLGVGPSAHSYDGASREFNVSNNSKYLSAISRETIPSTREILTVADVTNEYLLTGLRTKWGVDIKKLNSLSGERFSTESEAMLADLIRRNWIVILNDTILLTQAGKLFADRISSDLFIED